ncbi:MAG: response regulator [Betaproteobacteria bacterium]|nr:response regulator [Betaproteobacteria bacterium]
MRQQPKPDSPKPVVMIVDDHTQVRRALLTWLSGTFSGAEIITAETGEDAVALAGERRIHVALMDIELPGIDGIEATRRIKAIAPQTRVIVLTNHADQPYRDAAEAAGASAYVLKYRIGTELEPMLAPMLAEAIDDRRSGISNAAGATQDSAHGRDAASLDEAVRQAVGLRLRDQDLAQLAAWKRERVRALALSGGNRYEQLLAEDSVGARRERELLCERFTTGETYFFRDPGQFALIREKLLPEIIERRARQRSLRLWSAGCAAGEEAYSLAMLVDELAPQLAGWKLQILGTDINSKALEKARAGVYGQWSFRALDPGRKQRYFRARGDRWEIDPRLRRLVGFAASDLVHDAFPDPAVGLSECDLILCRNVFIYLDPAAIARITAKFAKTLAEGGYLIAGHSELFGHNIEPLRTRVFAQSVVLQKTTEPPGATDDRLTPAQLPAGAAPAPPPLPRRVPLRAPRVQKAPQANPPSAPAVGFDQLLEQGWRHANRGMPDAADEDCRKAIAIAAFDPRPYYLLAQLAQERGDTAQAKTLLKKVIYLDPSFVAAYLELGALHEQDGEDERARRMRQAARRELGKQPANAEVAPYGKSTAGEVLAYIDRLLDGPAKQAARGVTGTAVPH